MADVHPGSSSDLLSISQDRRGDAVIVHLVGEIDLTSLRPLRAAVDAALTAATPPHPVVFDLTGVGFLASTGLAELTMAHERAANQHTPLRIVATGRAVLRPLQVTGMATILDIRPDITAALTPAPDGPLGREAR